MRNRDLLVLLAALLTVLGAAPAAFQFPATDAGRRASGYLEAFNGGRDEALRAFLVANVAPAALAQRSVDDRIAIARQIRAAHVRLVPHRLLDAAEDHVHLVADDAHGESLEMTFLCEATPPHRLLGLRIEQGAPPEEAATLPAMPLSDAQAIHAWGGYLDSLTRIGQFSGAALLAKQGKVLFESAYGEASRERHVPNRVDTKFNLGSINKIFTKLAVAQLVDQGKLRLDDTIDKFLPDYPKAVASKVTVRQLLDHRGGIGDVFGPAYDRADRSQLRRVSDWIPLFRDQPLAFEPGARQQYSNGGYVLLGAIVEKVSGEDYYDYVRRHLDAPLGMHHTDHYSQDDSVANLAEGYTREAIPGLNPDATGLANNERTRPMRGSPAGGGYSTLADLLKLTQALRAGAVVRPQALRDGFAELAPGPDGVMGLGIGGGAPGINAAVEMSGDYTIIVLANLDPPAAERAASTLRRWLPGRDGAKKVEVGGGEARRGTSEPDGAFDGPVQRIVRGPAPPARTVVPSGGVEVDMLRSDHLPAVSVMIDGHGPYRFALDTGGGGMASVDSAVAAALGLRPIGQVHAGDPSGRNSMVLDLVHLESISIGGARFESLDAAVRSGRLLRMGQPVDGILGFGLFQDCLLTLDYPGHHLRIDRGELPAPNGRDILAFELRHGVPSVRLQIDSLWVEADVDAGSPGGFTFPAALESKLALAAPAKVVGHGRTIGNDFEIREASLEGSVRLGGFEYPRATVGFQPVFPMANVGSRVLREFRVTFDQKNERMRLAKPM